MYVGKARQGEARQGKARQGKGACSACSWPPSPYYLLYILHMMEYVLVGVVVLEDDRVACLRFLGPVT